MAKRGKKDIDEQLLLAIAAGASVAAAAKQCSCSERTVRRRLSDAAFRNRVHETRSELVRSAVGRLATLGTLAADELYRLIQQGDSDQVKLGASRAVLGYMLAGHEQTQLLAELEELKKAVEKLAANKGET